VSYVGRMKRRERIRRAAGGELVHLGLRGLSRAGRSLPVARPNRHGVTVTRDISYGAGLLDVYRPEKPRGVGVLYVHGGAFRILSKETHWIFGLALAREGYTVFNIDYRLAPANPYPAAHSDTAQAWLWLLDNAAAWGVDPERLVVAGESAGGNLATALTLAACTPRPEDFARPVYERGVRPAAVLELCGLLRITERTPHSSRFIQDRLEEACRAVLPGQELGTLVDPLAALASQPTERPMPPFFISIGSRDPLIDENRELAELLQSRGTRADFHLHPGEPHAFQALVWSRESRQNWRNTYAFLDEVIPGA